MNVSHPVCVKIKPYFFFSTKCREYTVCFFIYTSGTKMRKPATLMVIATMNKMTMNEAMKVAQKSPLPVPILWR